MLAKLASKTSAALLLGPYKALRSIWANPGVLLLQKPYINLPEVIYRFFKCVLRGNVVRVLNGVVEFGFEGELTQVSRDGCNIPVGIFFDPEANAGLIIPALLRLSMFEVFVRDRFGCAEFNLQISHLPGTKHSKMLCFGVFPITPFYLEPVRYVPESFFEGISAKS